MVKQVPHTIRVVTQIERNEIPKIVDIEIIPDLTNQLGFRKADFQSLLADFQQIEVQEDSSREIRIRSIPFDSLWFVMELLKDYLDGLSGRVRIAISIPDLEQEAVKLLQQRNEAQAAEIASTLLVRLLSVECEDLTSFMGMGEAIGFREFFDFLHESYELPVHIKLTRTYRTSRFSSLRYNAKLIMKSFDLALIWKQLRFSSFKRKFSRNRPVAEISNDRSRVELNPLKAVIFGHFSFPGGGGTFGDLEALEVVQEWLYDLRVGFDVVTNHEDGVEGIDISEVRTEEYGIFIFVCGPWYSTGKIHAKLLDDFNHCYKIGVNLTTFVEGSAGFDQLLSRDNLIERNVDIAFGRQLSDLPVAGILLIERQKTYGFKQRHQYIKKVVNKYLESKTLAPIWLDTNASLNQMGIKTPEQFESIIKKTDFVITDRLHGVVLSLKNSVPVIAIDPVEGGGKVSAQAKALGWPLLLKAEEFSMDELHKAVNKLLTSDYSSDLARSRARAEESIEKSRRDFNQAVGEAQVAESGCNKQN